MILFHSADLIWATKIKGAADAAGIAARPVRNEQMLRDRLADSPVTALMVDLDQAEVALALIAVARSVGPIANNSGGGASGEQRAEGSGSGRGNPDRRIRILAYGPHVLTEAFAAARAAGADSVMARGGLDARLEQVLRSLVA